MHGGKNRHRLSPHGDTIIEVMVVLAILGLAISILFATANRSLLNTRQAQENTIATTLVQSQIEALRNMTGNPTTSPNNIFIPGPYCINTTNPKSFSVVKPDTDPQCSPANSPYHLSITYSNTDSTFKVIATWPDILNQGTDTVTMYYRLHPGAVPGSPPPPPLTGEGTCDLPATHPTGNNPVSTWQMDYAIGSPSNIPYPFYTTVSQTTGSGGYHGPLYKSFESGGSSSVNSSIPVITAKVVLCVSDASQDFTGYNCGASAKAYPDGSFDSNPRNFNNDSSGGIQIYYASGGRLRKLPDSNGGFVSGAYYCTNDYQAGPNKGPGNASQKDLFTFDASSLGSKTETNPIWDVGISFVLIVPDRPPCQDPVNSTIDYCKDYYFYSPNPTPSDYNMNYVKYEIQPRH